jgi:cell fate regulator YaaT (PSP1 superfamily)
MCCLSYEHSTYEDFKKGLPRVGKTVQTAQGSGVVQKHNPLAETMFVKVDEETVIEVTREEIIRDPEKSASKKISKPSDEDRPEESSVE